MDTSTQEKIAELQRHIDAHKDECRDYQTLGICPHLSKLESEKNELLKVARQSS